MEKLKNIENIILLILWTISLTTFPIALLNDYSLFPSDYFGFVGLVVVSTFSYLKPTKSFEALLVLLLLGLFNLLSFAYFINMVMTFGISIFVTPGIQLISLVFLIVLVAKRRNKTRLFYLKIFGLTEEDKEQSRKSSQNFFKRKFENLTDIEIENRLQEDLVPEAIEALVEIKEERKNALQ
ncbi:hypothetical protein [Saccharicrinis sp. GN24d3]|uniref:hypothetical protein n=1 Tax=Saccharicrinis sp. GN24d3 TaxID=3458416 RepID=UPI004035AD2E